MTTGSPLYLVSACGTAEEFVAAFRRYADRTGLFIPAAQPLPAGRKGRLALTLKDGGVMIEGEAEILQSSAKPTVLHGRPGMTVKFIDPDEPSKLVIGELEKARLAMKPAAPSVAPRPATIPASPRAVVPAPSGRIDAANALAECVVIGDPSALSVTANAPRSAMGDRFGVPAIPTAPARPKTPSTPPEAPKPPSAAPTPKPTQHSQQSQQPSSKMTTIGSPIIDKAPATPDSGRVVSNATTLGMPALDRKPSGNDKQDLLTTQLGVNMPANPTPQSMPAQNPLLETKLGHAPTRADATPPRVPIAGTPPLDAKKPTVHEETTSLGTAPPKPAPAAKPLIAPVSEDEATAIGAVPSKKTTNPMAAAPPPKPTPTSLPAATAAPTPAVPVAGPEGNGPGNPRHESAKHHRATSIGFPVVRSPFETQPLGLVPPAPPGGSAEAVVPDPAPPSLPKGRPAPPPPRGRSPTTPPLTPRHPTPVAPVPIVRPPAKSAPSVSEEERTDLGIAPTAPATPIEVGTQDSGAELKPPEQPTRSGGMRASEILAAIPAGDWTMSPDESTPHALPPEAKVAAAVPPQPSEPTPAPPKGPPTGDWTIQLDPATGWTEPEKLAKGEKPPSGNPVVAVSSDKPINVVQWDDKPTGIGEAKIEVDSTLMEPLTPMPDDDDDDEPAQIVDRKPGDVAPPPMPPAPMPPTPGFPQLFSPGALPPPRASSTDLIAGYAPATAHLPAQDPSKQKKMILLAVGAGALLVGAIVILVMTLSGGKKPAATPGPGSASAKTPIVTAPSTDAAVEAKQPEQPVGSGSQHIVVEPPGSGETPATVDAGAAPEVKLPSRCAIELKTLPTGAEVYLDKQKLGTTPGSFVVPCGVESKLSLRKKTFPTTLRTVKPTTETTRLTVKLSRPTFSVKVTSTPAGATITASGKSMGVTPTTIKLSGFDSTSLTLSKPGFTSDTQRVTPKQNNTSHHVTLKKGKGR